MSEPIDSKTVMRPFLWALSVLVLTSLHHAYGAFVFETPWRLDIVPVATGVAAVLALTFGFGWLRRGTNAGRAVLWLAAIIVLVFPVAMIGLFEGAYNHVLKNAIYFGWGEAATRLVFPPPTYEMPNDLLFELSGILQFPAALMAGLAILAILRRMRLPVQPASAASRQSQ